MSTIFKRFQIFSSLLLVACLAMFFNACDTTTGTDPCETVNCINGDCLVSATGDPFCNCNPGFSGPTCETVDDPCSAVQCPSNATCLIDSVTGEAYCECDLGYEGDNCDVEIRSKFLGTYTGKVTYTDGDIFTDFAQSVTVTADPSNIEQFFINNFEDYSIPSAERFSFLSKVRPIDQKANTFEILNSYTKDYTLDGVQYRVRYSGTGLGTRNEANGHMVIEYKVEDINPSTNVVISSLTNILTLTPQ